jgi:hypothetical protein
MPFRSNFLRVRHTEGDPFVRIEGETNQELLDAAAQMYVGVGPGPDLPDMDVYAAPLLTEWSVDNVPASSILNLERTPTLVGIVILKADPRPFVWVQHVDTSRTDPTGTTGSLPLSGEEEPLREGGDIPVVVEE